MIIKILTMRSKIFYSVFFLLPFLFVTESIYTYSVPAIEGTNYPISNCQGKKILIVTLPLQQNPSTDSVLTSLDTLGLSHINELTIIGVPAVEDGYSAAQQQQLQQWYRSKLGQHIIITSGLFTRKSSGTQQHPLFRWLTTVTENEAFDIDAAGEGYKFFVGTSGRLFAVLRPHTRIWSQAVQKTLRL